MIRKSVNAFPFVLAAFTLGLGAASIPTAQARAAEPVYSVTLAAPVAAPTREIVNGRMWKCEGDRCIGQSDGSRDVVACKRVAAKFGQIVRFAGAKGELGAEQLAQCNGE